jgi:hypothetical protein
VCRRAERSVYPALEAGDASTAATKYLNRCSDLLFASARFAAAFVGESEQQFKASRDGNRGLAAVPTLRKFAAPTDSGSCGVGHGGVASAAPVEPIQRQGRLLGQRTESFTVMFVVALGIGVALACGRQK